MRKFLIDDGFRPELVETARFVNYPDWISRKKGGDRNGNDEKR